MNEKPISSGRIIWLFGRPCSGKSTIGKKLEEILTGEGRNFFLIDADFLRSGLNNDLGYSLTDRFENIRRAAEMAAFIALKGNASVVCAFITPLAEMRELAQVIASRNGIPIHLVYVDTPLSECMLRDVKGHYHSAKTGRMDHFTGISSPFEEPGAGEQRIPTLDTTPEECARRIISIIG
jgi:adenylylsulfate kinase-like enzyme